MQQIRILVVILLFLMNVRAFTQNPEKEMLIKAAFIEKFARFTEWPSDTKMDYFYITVIGNNDFGNTIEKFAKSYKIKGKSIKLTFIKDIKQLDECHLLFISRSEKDRLESILKNIENLPIMTFGDTKGYSEKGVQFNLYESKNETYHFEVNVSAVNKSKLKVDPLLLNYAKKQS